ncbi:MAG: PD-(D/E)XK nuclease family protein, partial [Kangiellaceae bacterium]|nr:PD-(D/E)XK nuclease family protein [Kangiellaceae bacterium]
GEKPFRKWLAGCFEAVGGLLQLDFESDLDDYNACLDKLVELNEGGELSDRKAINEAIEKLYAAPNPQADNQVQLMTIHKSKGLEFDTVILPNLDRTPPNVEQALLKWTEVVDEQGRANQLLAISKETGKETDEVYQYINYLDKRKAEYEAQRVLYVAATRAKSKLYLFGNVTSSEKEESGIKPANKRSYLGLMWDGVIENATVKNCDIQYSAEKELPIYESRFIKRSNIEKVEFAPVSEFSEASNEQEYLDSLETVQELSDSDYASLEFNQVVEQASSVGSVIHRQLEWLSKRWNPAFEFTDNWPEIIKGQLLQEGIDKGLVETQAEKVMAAIHTTLSSDFGKFVLTDRESAQSELVLHKKLEGGHFLTRIIDRTFIDDNTRWIIDYKSSVPDQGESLEHFIQRERALYQEQITDYFNMFVKLEEHPTKAGLYFPLIDHFELMLESDSDC